MKVKENRRRCLIIIEISNKKECSGCYACVSICPKRCISMQIDNEGFWYPLVDKNECIECGMCEKHCPVKKSKRNYRDIEGYAAINKNSTVQKRSSSGGVFTLLAEYVLENGGVVYGAAFDEEYMVRHIGVERIHELGKLEGYKYVQSHMVSIYLEVKEKLNRGKIVYFSGTPCQVDGLIAFLGKEYDNLICQDIICHGVPSPKIWKQYLKQFNIEKNAKILFRDKRTGWESYSFTIDQREKYTQRASENLYMKVFLNNLCLRPSCYQCHSKGNFRKSDITLGDFWGVEKVCSEMYNEKGTSLILINSEKGKKIFGKIKRNLKIKEINIEEAIKYNESIYKSAFENKKREKFMSEIDKKKESFNNIAWKYVKDPVILRVKKKLYNLLNC